MSEHLPQGDVAGPTIPGVPESERLASSGPAQATDFAQLEIESLTQGLSEDELRRRATHSEHNRSERFRDQFETLAIIGLWAVSLAVAAMGVVWIAHLILPLRWRWLSSEDLTHIQSIVTAGLLVGIVGSHFRKRLGS